MRMMFASADAFNQPLNSWDVSSVTDMYHMFSSAIAFDQDISAWDVSYFSAEPTGFSFTTSANWTTAEKPQW
jgi:surface protein